MSNNLSVKITADIVDLQTKFAVARAETSALAAEMNKLARAQNAGTIDAAGSARMQQVAGDMLHARQAAQGYASSLQEAGFAVNSFNRSVESTHGSISSATQEFRALFDEISSGRTRRSPGTIAIILQRVLGLSGAALLATGGVAGLVAGLGYLAYRAVEAGNALNQMHLDSLCAGNDIGRGQFQQLGDQLAQLPGIADSASSSIETALAGVPGMTFGAMTTAARITSEQMQQTGQDADKAGEAMAKALQPSRSAVEVAKAIGGITQAQLDQARAADQSGNANAVMAQKLSLLSSELARGRGAVGEYGRSWGLAIGETAEFFGRMLEFQTGQEATTAMLKERTAAWQANAAAIRQSAAAMAAMPATPEQTLKTGVTAAEGENPISQQVTQANQKIQEMNAALAVAQQRGDQVNVTKLDAGLEKARTDLSNLQFGPVLERMREQMDQVASTWDGTQSGMLAKQLQVAQSMLSQTQGSAQATVQVEREIARLQVQARQAAGSEIVANARQQVSELGAAESAGAAQRLNAQEIVWEKLLAGDQLNAAQRVEVEHTLTQAITEATKQAQTTALAISKQDAATDIAISKMKIDAEKETLEASVQANAETAAQKIAILKNLTNQEYQLDLQSLQNELTTLDPLSAEYDRVFNQIRELKAKNVQDMASLDENGAAAAKQQAKEQATDWKSMNSEIMSAEGTLVSDLISRRKSLSQSLLQIGSQMLTKEISNQLKAMTQRILIGEEGAIAQKATEQGGYVYHELMQLLGVSSTKASQTAQTAAVMTGNSARNAATATAIAAGKAQQTATGGAQIMADAAKAYSGTYAGVAQIPYVGWIMAPPAAAAAYAAVAGYEGLASLATGTAYVPHDMLAQIHEGEAVLPKPMAQTFRESGLGGSGGSDGGGGDTHIHNHFSAFDTRGLRDMVKDLMKDPGAHREMARHLGVSKTVIARGTRL